MSAVLVGVLAVAAVSAITSLDASAARRGNPKPPVTTTAPPATSAPTTTAPTTSAPPSTTSPPATTAPPATPSAPPTTTASSSPTAPPAGLCDGVTWVEHAGALYCPAVIVGAQAGAYVGTRIVLQGVIVTSVSGNLVGIIGGPSCLPPPPGSEPVYCGNLVPEMTVDFGSMPVPSAGDAIDLYGIQRSATVTPVDHVVVGCDPDIC